jgi:cell division protein FtsB
MDQPLEKSSVTSPEAAKKAESQKLQAPSGFADELSKYPSFMDGLLKFICHPFILLGGIMVAIYFFYKARQSGSIDLENSKLRDTNKELLTEVNALRKENKILRDQLGLLPDGDEYDYPARERKLLTSGKKKISVARLE